MSQLGLLSFKPSQTLASINWSCPDKGHTLIGMCVRRHGPPTARTLLSSRGLEPGHQLTGHPSAVFHLDTLGFGPLADLRAVHPIRPPSACATPRPPTAESISECYSQRWRHWAGASSLKHSWSWPRRFVHSASPRSLESPRRRSRS